MVASTGGYTAYWTIGGGWYDDTNDYTSNYDDGPTATVSTHTRRRLVQLAEEWTNTHHRPDVREEPAPQPDTKRAWGLFAGWFRR